MNKEEIEIILKEISTPTGLTFSGDITLCNTDKEKILDHIFGIEEENKQLRAVLKDIEEYLESIKDMPDADMYIKLGEYKEFKHILDLIHKGTKE